MIRHRVKAIEGQAWKDVKSCLMGISVGQENCDGEKLRATFAWVSKRFHKLHIWIADTLHRYNLMFEHCESLEEATVRARLAGDSWIVRNSEALQKLPIPFTVSRWDQWLSDPRYVESYGRIRDLYEKSEVLQDAVRADAERYVESIIRRGCAIHDRQFAILNSCELIVEENSVFPLLIEDHDGVDVYPGSELQSTQLIRTLPLPGAPEALYRKKFTRISFKRLKSPPEELTSASA